MALSSSRFITSSNDVSFGRELVVGAARRNTVTEGQGGTCCPCQQTVAEAKKMALFELPNDFRKTHLKGGIRMNHSMEGHEHNPHGTGATEQVKDPVCGMGINPNSAFAQEKHDGKTYYFCSAHCQQKFKATPGKYEVK